MGQPVFQSRLALGPGHNPIHLVLVTLEHGDVVSHQQELRALQLAFGSLLNHALGLSETVQEKIAVYKTVVPKQKVGIGRNLFLGYLDHSVKSACSLGCKSP